MNQNYDLLNHANIIYRPFKFTKRLGSLSFYNLKSINGWCMDQLLPCAKFLSCSFLLFKNLIIFFFQKKLKVLNMKASSLLLKEKTVLEVINFIVTVFEIPVGGMGTPLSKWHCCQNPQSLSLEFLWYLLYVLADYKFVTQLNHLIVEVIDFQDQLIVFHGIGVS